MPFSPASDFLKRATDPIPSGLSDGTTLGFVTPSHARFPRPTWRENIPPRLASENLAPLAPLVNGNIRPEAFTYLSGYGATAVTFNDRFIKIKDDNNIVTKYEDAQMSQGIIRILNEAGAQQHVQTALRKEFLKPALVQAFNILRAKPTLSKHPVPKLTEIVRSINPDTLPTGNPAFHSVSLPGPDMD